MTRTVFVDTVFYLAVMNRRDALHERALDFAGNYEGLFLTTKFVLLEVGNSLCRVGSRSSFRKLMDRLRTHTETVILELSAEAFDRGEDLFAHRRDKEWSLTDCISFVTMNEYRLTEALTADHHFEQAGFTALLK